MKLKYKKTKEELEKITTGLGVSMHDAKDILSEVLHSQKFFVIAGYKFVFHASKQKNEGKCIDVIKILGMLYFIYKEI